MNRVDPDLEQVKETLSKIQLDDVSPREAWQLLSDIKEKLEKGKK